MQRCRDGGAQVLRFSRGDFEYAEQVQRFRSAEAVQSRWCRAGAEQVQSRCRAGAEVLSRCREGVLQVHGRCRAGAEVQGRCRAGAGPQVQSAECRVQSAEVQVQRC